MVYFVLFTVYMQILPYKLIHFNRNISNTEFLGRAEIKVADIMRDSKDSCGPILQRFRLREVERGDVILKLDLRLFGGR